MNPIDYNKQYLQSELPEDVFNSGNGDIKTFNGKQVKVSVNPNGTRSLSPYEWFPSFSDLGQTTTDFIKNLNATENQDLGAYLNKATSQAKPLDIYKQLQEMNQIPQMQKTAADMRGQLNDLEDTIRRIEPNVSATTQNSLVTEGQRQNMVTAQKDPLLKAYEPVATAYGRIQEGLSAANQNVSNMTQLTLQGQEQELRPYEKVMDVRMQQNARMLTGFTADRETQLTLLMEKLHRQQQLEDREWQLAAELAAEERAYSRELNIMKEQAKLSGSSEDRYINIGAGGLYDTQTGQIVKPYKSGSAATVNNGW